MRQFITSVVVLIAGGTIYAGEYGLDPSRKTDTVRFASTASLEFIEGKTGDIVGGFTFDPENAAAGVSGRLQVDLRTLKTGIDLRDRHMRENHLHTEVYPFAFFELTEVAGLPARLEPGQTVEATAAGEFFIHGNHRPIKADLEVTRLNAGQTGGVTGAIIVRARFKIDLDDFAIDRPKALFMKLAETIELDVAFQGNAGMPVPDVVLPDWPLLP